MLLIKTDSGQQVFKDRSVKLSPRQRSAFVIFDGKRSVQDVLAATAGLGLVQEDIDHMLALGLLAEPPANVASPILVAQVTDIPVPAGGLVDLAEAQSRYARAYPLATKLTASMGLRGFRLNLAVEAVGSYSQLLALFPKIKEAVGLEKAAALGSILAGTHAK